MRARLCAAVALTCSSLACTPSAPVQTVPIPPNDPTPPSLTLTVRPPNRQLLTVEPLSTPASSKVGSQDRIDLEAKAEDGNSGIRNVSIWYTRTRTSVDPATGIGTVTGPGLVGNPQAFTPNPAEPHSPGDQAPVRRSVFTTLSMLSEPIGNNVTLVYDVWATAENYHGGKVETSHVTLTWP